jgi:outer membrane protein assembly factor BamA
VRFAPPVLLPPQGPADLPARPQWGADEQVDYVTPRFEPAGFPIIGGNSDIGFELGAATTLSYFSGGTRPYAWNIDVTAAASIKGGPNGTELAQHAYQTNIDWPGLFGGGVRLNPQVSYSRTINVGYFGIGNDSSDGAMRLMNADPGRYHQFIQSVALVRSIVRISLRGPLGAMYSAAFRYVVPDTYAGSKLAQDEQARTVDGSPWLYGTRAMSIASLAGGFIYDSRDNEIFAKSGMMHQLGVRYEQGIPFDDRVSYGEVSGIASGFVPVRGPVIFAWRLVAAFQFGNIPFYDLFAAGPFQLKELPGGSTGIRGVPVGRYLGPIKIVGNAELRAMLVQITLFKQKFKVGSDLFFDTGRVWSDYSFRSPLDGTGLGLKYGVGGGLYWLWGQAAIFRMEVAYSPDAASENHGLPLGIYVEDGTMF